MIWLAKAILQKFFSALPQGHRVNYLFQRHVSGSLPHSPNELVSRFKTAVEYVHAAQHLGPMPQGPVTAYEFGAGQDLAMALSLYTLGVQNQALVDIRPIVDWELLNHAKEVFAGSWEHLTSLAGRHLRPFPAAPINSTAALRNKLGISYQSPVDAGDTGLLTANFDLVSSSHVLEHLSREAMLSILKECRRLVSPRGVICHYWNMQDHYSEFDSSISAYNFLTIHDSAWRLINSDLHFQNRLRLPDYEELFFKAGLRIVYRRVRWPDQEDMALLARLPLPSTLRGRHSLRELGARVALVVLKPI